MPSLSYSQEPPPVALRPFADESMGGWLGRQCAQGGVQREQRRIGRPHSASSSLAKNARPAVTAAMSNTSGAAKTGGVLCSEFDRLQARPRFWPLPACFVGAANADRGIQQRPSSPAGLPRRRRARGESYAAPTTARGPEVGSCERPVGPGRAGPMSPAEHFGRPPCARSHSSSQCDFHALCGLPHGRMGERPLRLLCTNLGGKASSAALALVAGAAQFQSPHLSVLGPE